MPKELCHYVFVYGTLRKGQPNNYLLDGMPMVARHEIEGYRMFSLGPYPGIQPLEGAIVRGEVYAVTEECLRALDRLEGTPYLYERIIVPFNGLMAWAYVYARDARKIESITTGFIGNQSTADWVQYREEQHRVRVAA